MSEVTAANPLDTADAVPWAEEFMRLFGHRRDEIDESLMLGWFANAIMKGYDTARAKYEPLSPPAAGPGFDAAEFLFRFAKFVCQWVTGGKKETRPIGEIVNMHLVELRAAMGAGADDGEPVTEEWLRSVGFTNAPNKAYVRLASKDNAVAVRLTTGEVEIYDNESMEMCRVYGVTRGRMRSLCSALGIPLPAAPGERNGE